MPVTMELPVALEKKQIHLQIFVHSLIEDDANCNLRMEAEALLHMQIREAMEKERERWKAQEEEAMEERLEMGGCRVYHRSGRETSVLL